jgi:hypothetical protein
MCSKLAQDMEKHPSQTKQNKQMKTTKPTNNRIGLWCFRNAIPHEDLQ